MILFAIPRKGSVMDNIQQMLAGDGRHPRGQLLQQIPSKSGLLIHQLADFNLCWSSLQSINHSFLMVPVVLIRLYAY